MAESKKDVTITKAQQKWLLRLVMDGGRLMAECDSPKDKKLARLERAGILECYDCMFRNNYYTWTRTGCRAFASSQEQGEK